jgi:hypothetical protein
MLLFISQYQVKWLNYLVISHLLSRLLLLKVENFIVMMEMNHLVLELMNMVCYQR